MTIAKNNLFSESFDVVKSVIEDNVSDPTNADRRKWIYASFPDITSAKFQGYPFIVIKSPDVNLDQRDFDTLRQNNFRFLITVWSDTSSEVDSLTDSIYNQIESNQDTLNDNGLSNPEMDSSPFSVVEDQNGKKIFNRVIGIIFGGVV